MWNSPAQQASLLDELNATSGAIESGIHSIDFFPSIVTVSPDVYSSMEFDPDNPDPSFDRDNPKAISKSRNDNIYVNGTQTSELRGNTAATSNLRVKPHVDHTPAMMFTSKSTSAERNFQIYVKSILRFQ